MLLIARTVCVFAVLLDFFGRLSLVFDCISSITAAYPSNAKIGFVRLKVNVYFCKTNGQYAKGDRLNNLLQVTSRINDFKNFQHEPLD